WILRLDELGEVIWQHCYGGENQDVIQAVGEYSDGTYWAVGFTRSTTGYADCNANRNDDYWILQLDQQGEVIQRVCLGGSGGDQLEDAFLVSGDNLLLVGHTSSSDGNVSFNHGGKDVWLIQLDAGLSVVWEKTF